MCGIVGALSFGDSGFSVSEPYIEKMRDTMVHRGPDGAGTWISPDRRVGLGHRRLSIIDLSDAAAQPMCSTDGTLWITFNGEIYNHAELRRELEKTSRRPWKTDHSDTEVVIRAFEEWGIDCIKRFRGMYAFAIWDTRKQELWLVRDRIGIKPLYYTIQGGKIVFASEIKAILKDPSIKRSVNEPGLFHFLSFLSVPAPETLFEGVRKLPGGSWLRVCADGSVKEHRYWDVLDHVEPRLNATEDDLTAEIKSRLKTAVDYRKVSDVPVGVFLSGGIDSSTNAALFSEGSSQPVKTFSIGYEGEYSSYQNELDFARMAADHCGAKYYEQLLKFEDLVSFLPELVRLQDEPIADPVCVPVYYVSKLAKEAGVTVCQVGEGADELFCGYSYWRLMSRLQKLNSLPVPRALKKVGLRGLAVANREYGFDYEWLRRASLGLPIFWGGAEAYSHQRKSTLVPPHVLASFGSEGSWQSIASIYDRFQEKAPDKSFLNWMSYLDLNNRLPELLLMRIDKMTMATSLEARVPFLDHEFVELAMSIRTGMKIKGGVGKHILRQAVRGVIPDEIIDRKKQGFDLPLHDWFLGDFGKFARDQLKVFCAETGLLNFEPIEQMLKSPKPYAVWPLLNVALWWDCYFGDWSKTEERLAAWC